MAWAFGGQEKSEMSKQKALLMAIILILFGIFIFQTERQEFLEKSALEKPAELILGDIKEEQIKQIIVVAPTNSYRLQKTNNNRWILIKPEGVPANPEMVSTLIKSLLKLSAKNIIEANEIEHDQSLYGLVPPNMMLTLEGDFGKRIFSFGKKVEASGRRYLQSENDQRFFLVENNIFNLLNASLDQIFNKNPFHLESAKITEFSLRRDDGEDLRFFRDGDQKQWKFRSLSKSNGSEMINQEFKADNNFIEQKLSAFNKLKAQHVSELTAETLALYGLKVPKLSFNIVMDDDSELNFLVGEGISMDALNPETIDPDIGTLSPQLAFYIKLQGADYIYQIPHVFFSDFLQPAYIFQNKTPFSEIKKEEIEKIILKNNSEIKEASESSDSALFEKLFGILQNFSVISYQVINFEDKKILGLTEPAWSLECILKNSKNTLSISLGNELKTKQQQSKSPGSKPPAWIELKLIDGSTIPALASYDIYSKLK